MYFIDPPDIIDLNFMTTLERQSIKNTETHLPGDASFERYREHFFYTLEVNPNNPKQLLDYVHDKSNPRKIRVIAAMLSLEKTGGNLSLIEPVVRAFPTRDITSITNRFEYLNTTRSNIWFSTAIAESPKNRNSNYSTPLLRDVGRDQFYQEVIPYIQSLSEAYPNSFIKIFPQDNSNFRQGRIRVKRSDGNNPERALGPQFIFELDNKHTDRNSDSYNPDRVMLILMPEPVVFTELNCTKAAELIYPLTKDSHLWDKIDRLNKLFNFPDTVIEFMFEQINGHPHVKHVTDIDLVYIPSKLEYLYLKRLPQPAMKFFGQKFLAAKILPMEAYAHFIYLAAQASNLNELEQGVFTGTLTPDTPVYIPSLNRPRYPNDTNRAIFAYRETDWYKKAASVQQTLKACH